LVMNVLAAWVSWWVLYRAVSGQSAHSWIYPVLAFSVWGIFFTLGTIFVKNRKLLYSVYFLCGAGYIFFVTITLSLLIVALVVLFLILTEKQIKKEVERGIKIDFYHLVSHSLRFFVSTVCIVVAVAYYLSITHRSAPTAISIETKTLETEIDWGLKAVALVLPEDKRAMIDDINNNISVDDFFTKNFVEPESAEVPNELNSATDTTRMIGDAAAVEVKKKMLDKSKRDLAKQLGVDVVGEQPMKYVLMAYIDKTERNFFDYSGTDKFYIPLIFALGLFLTTRILGTAVDILLGILILSLIKLLRVTGVINLRNEQREIAMIEYAV
jgi:hypothetical protein